MKRTQMVKSRIAKWLMKPRIAGGVVLAVVLVATLQKYTLGAEQMNNLLIFRVLRGIFFRHQPLCAFARRPCRFVQIQPNICALYVALNYAATALECFAVEYAELYCFIVGIHSVSHLLYRSDDGGDERNRTITVLLWICAIEL